jgi:FkbM family methyltransferase
MENPIGLRESLKARLLELRFALGHNPANLTEAQLYLRSVARDEPCDTLLSMPWGELACSNTAVVRAQFEEIFIKRHYEFKSTVQAPVIIDCGGNIGLSAIWFSQNYPGCRLTVLEADPAVADKLRCNLSRAGFGDTKVENLAVWTENTEIPFSATGMDNGRIDPEGGQTVRTIDVVDLIPDQVDLMKIDIEGAEFDVIDRMIDTGVIDRVRNLAVEFHPSRSTLGRMMTLFERLGEIGMTVSFESYHGPAAGLEDTEAAFPVVGRHRMFVQAYIWRGAPVAAALRH